MQVTGWETEGRTNRDAWRRETEKQGELYRGTIRWNSVKSWVPASFWVPVSLLKEIVHLYKAWSVYILLSLLLLIFHITSLLTATTVSAIFISFTMYSTCVIRVTVMLLPKSNLLLLFSSTLLLLEIIGGRHETENRRLLRSQGSWNPQDQVIYVRSRQEERLV